MNIAELVATIGFDVSEDQLDRGLQGAARGVQSWTGKVTASMGTAFKTFFLNDLYQLGVAGAARLAQAFNPVDVFRRVEGVAQSLDEVAKRARAIGVTTEALQELRFVAGQTGVDAGHMERSFVRLAQRVGEAATGSQQAAQDFASLGLRVSDLQAMSASDRFQAMIGGLGAVQDETQRTAIGMRLLGEEAFPQFATLLQGGAEGVAQLRTEAQRLGFIVSDEQARRAEKFNDTLDKARRALRGLTQRAVLPLIGPLTTLAERFGQFLDDNRAILSLGFDAFASVFEVVFGAMLGLLGDLTAALQALDRWLGLTEGGLEGLTEKLKLATIAALAFAGAWAWTARSTLVPFLARVGANFAALTPKIAAATVAAVNFFRTMTLASTWAALKAGFSALVGWVGAVALPFILVAGTIAAVLLLLDDVWNWAQGNESILGEVLGLDPSIQADLEKFYDTLALIGLALSGVLALLTGIPGVVAAIAVATVWVAANWDRVSEAVSGFYGEMVDVLADSFVAVDQWARDTYDSVVALFMGIVRAVKDAISGAVDAVMDIPRRARGLLSRIPGFGSDEEAPSALGAFAAGAVSPGVDRAAQVFRSRSTRSVNVSPNINVQVDATDRSTREAADIFEESIWERLSRSIRDAYDGEED